MISESIAGSILETLTHATTMVQRVKYRMLPYGDKFEKPICRGKVKPLHVVLLQETSDMRQKDKEHKTAYFIC